MNAIHRAIVRLVRGPGASRLLERLGIDARRYWLLMDLFGQLSERGEMLDQLGRNGVAVGTVALLYAAFSGLFSLIAVLTQPALASYFSTFLAFTAFLLLSVLLSEAGNSLLNPAEGLVLAHQPVNGATYTAAKLTHLARIVLYLVPGLNAIPAFAGLLLKGAGWSYPLLHLAAAFAVGSVSALLCCAVYGWLMRFVPAPRLKAAGQFAASIPLLAMIWQQPMWRLLASPRLRQVLPAQTGGRWALGLAVAAAAAAIVGLGIRSLSADYLIRVSGILHGGPPKGARTRRSWLGGIVARLCGGQPGRAGFVFVSRMARRDYQFRRQIFPLVIGGLAGLLPLAASGWRTDPFSGRFTAMHLVPHVLGGASFVLCSLLAYGNDFKGAWIFLAAPGRAFGPFARGVYAALFIPMIVVPHGILLMLLAWPWGIWHAGLFVAYSVGASSVYLAMDLRRIDGMPFSKQVDTTRGATMLPLIMMGGVAAAVAVALQHFLVFRSAGTVLVAGVVIGAAAFFLTRGSVGALERAIRYDLGLRAAESGTFYQEVDI